MLNIPVNDCCGCTACYNACPKSAISMLPDDEGFLYPVVDSTKCIECGICEKACPIIEYTPATPKKLEAYALRTATKDDLKTCTSGGFVPPLANWVFEQGGVVWAATYDDDWSVCHKPFTSDDDEYVKTRGSKYVQSRLDDAFSIIKQTLENGQVVCFIGTTCQVYGLKSYLKKDYDRLVTVDLVCHGTPSPKLWDKYIKYQTQKYGAQPRVINFRNKTYGYHSGTMKIEFANGKNYTGSARVDLMLKSFFSEISSRPSCYRCTFKERYRVSDFTIFDCWHMSDLTVGQKDDDLGYTNVIIQSDKGKSIFSCINDRYIAFAVDADKAIALDGVMVEKSATAHQGRALFYKDIDDHDLKTHIKKHVGITVIDYLLENSKSWVYKLGFIGALRSVKKRLLNLLKVSKTQKKNSR